MTGITVGLLAVTLSIDAFLAALGQGARARVSGLGMALRTGVVFGAVEAATPLIGWGLGSAASSHVEAIDHWIAFGLLFVVGLRMMLNALKERDQPRTHGHGTATLVATAFGTSVDALAVGASLALLDVNMIAVAITIGATTLVLSTAGVLAGKYLGDRLGRWAELLGGVALICLGLGILQDHLIV